MRTDQQLAQDIRDAFTASAAGLEPRTDLSRILEAEIVPVRVPRRRRRRWINRGAVSGVLAVAVVIAVVLVAVLDLHSSGTMANRSTTSPALPVGSSRLVTTAPDPRGDGSWGVRETRVGPHRACLLVGRVDHGRLGVLGRDGAYHNDGKLHPLSAREFSHCGKTDADGHLFLDVSLNAVVVSGAQGGRLTSCTVRGEPFANGSQSYCPSGDLRAIFFGTVGPDATRVTYSINGHAGSARTGQQGAYLIVVPTTGQTCTPGPVGGSLKGQCEDSPSMSTAHGLRPGAITSVTYRNGSTCTLTNSDGTLVNRVCPNVGYAHYPPRTIPTITAQQAHANLHVSHVVTDHICYKTGVKPPVPQISCNHAIPHGYAPQQAGGNSPTLLVSVRFTAPLTATNHHSVYEYSIGPATGTTCKSGGGGVAGTSMTPIAKGTPVLFTDQETPCPGTYQGVVSYQPNGHPGRDSLLWDQPIHDGSTIVSHFRFTVR